MSLSVPHPLAVVMNFLGFAWPEIDEDAMHEAADLLRRFGRDLSQMVETTDSKLMVDLAQVCEAQAYHAMAEDWCRQTKGRLHTLVECCNGMAQALDLAADGVVAMKLAVIAQLEIALAEFLADQAAAVATLGLAEAALPLLYAAQNRILSGIMQTFLAEVMGVLIEQSMRPLCARIADACAQLLNPVPLPPPRPLPGMKVDTAAVRRFAADMGEQARGAREAGRRLSTTMSTLSFTQG